MSARHFVSVHHYRSTLAYVRLHVTETKSKIVPFGTELHAYHAGYLPPRYPVPAIPLKVELEETTVCLYEGVLVEETNIRTGEKTLNRWWIPYRWWD